MRRCFLLTFLVVLFLAEAAIGGEIRPFQRGSWRDILVAHGGKPLAAHFWSLSCAPCMAELPRLAAWRLDNPGKTLVLIATDPMERVNRLREVLARAGLGDAEAWAFADPFAERLRFEVDSNWRGELPMTRMIGPDGTAETVIGPLLDPGGGGRQP